MKRFEIFLLIYFIPLMVGIYFTRPRLPNQLFVYQEAFLVDIHSATERRISSHTNHISRLLVCIRCNFVPIRQQPRSKNLSRKLSSPSQFPRRTDISFR